jgi:hypothetical protein
LKGRSNERRYQCTLACDPHLLLRRPAEPELNYLLKLRLQRVVLLNGVAPQCVDTLAVAADFVSKLHHLASFAAFDFRRRVCFGFGDTCLRLCDRGF